LKGSSVVGLADVLFIVSFMMLFSFSFNGHLWSLGHLIVINCEAVTTNDNE
jgi:hypothetical protein